ncbi:IclR family transcriptional regulator [Paraburkholderia susongensis]|nr:IclR family transcriptional regulator [Paraburkholderia susongensis]
MKTIATALEILEVFTDDNNYHSVSELADRFALPRSQVSRILSTFRDAGWLEQHPKTRLYSVGVAAYAFGSRFIRQHPLTRQALPILRSVVDRSGFHATLSTLDGLRPLYLLGIEGPVAVDFTSDFGAYYPFHATAPGKALAAFAPSRIREQLLAQAPFERLTMRTIVEGERLRKELDHIARRGYSASDGERLAGIGGLAVPVIDHSGELVAAVGTAFPTQMVSPAEYEYQVQILRGAAHALAERFEGSPRVLRLQQSRRSTGNHPSTMHDEEEA